MGQEENVQVSREQASVACVHMPGLNFALNTLAASPGSARSSGFIKLFQVFKTRQKINTI